MFSARIAPVDRLVLVIELTHDVIGIFADDAFDI